MVFWDNDYWHNIIVTVIHLGVEKEYKITKTWDKQDIQDPDYWNWFGIKINEIINDLKSGFRDKGM